MVSSLNPVPSRVPTILLVDDTDCPAALSVESEVEIGTEVAHLVKDQAVTPLVQSNSLRTMTRQYEGDVAFPTEHTHACLDRSPSALSSTGNDGKLLLPVSHDMHDIVARYPSASSANSKMPSPLPCSKLLPLIPGTPEKQDPQYNSRPVTQAISREAHPSDLQEYRVAKAIEQSIKANANSVHARFIESIHPVGALKAQYSIIAQVTMTPPGQRRLTPNPTQVKHRALPTNSPLLIHPK